MSSKALHQEYSRYRDRGVEATRLGNLEKARAYFAEAARLAEGLDEAVQDRAFCNVAAIETEFGDSLTELIPRLRSILTKNSDLENSRLAAYHLARTYDQRKEYKKALFYARVAMERSERSGHDHWLVSSHNQMGTILVAESRFDEGRAHLETALQTIEESQGDGLLRALIQGNLGYCLLVQGEMGQGFNHVFSGLRCIRRNGAEAWAPLFHMTLCFGYLEIERLVHAEKHGRKALALAQEHGDMTTAKNSLFLLGEVASAAGDSSSARAYFSLLQQEFYPQHDFLADFLLAVDVRGLVNLKA